MGGIKRLAAQFLRFGVVGVAATGMDFGIMVLLTEALGVDPVVSSGVSFCASTVFNYLASMRFVFRHREGLSRRREFAIFLVLSLVGLGVNQLVMWGGTAVLGERWYVLVKVLATGVVMLWNFFSRKHWLDADES